MKSTIFCLGLALTLAVLPIHAQEIHLGVKGGVSIPQLSGSDDNELSRDYKSRLAPNFGAFIDVALNERVSFQTEANYAGQGGKRLGIQPISQPPSSLPPLPSGVYYFANFDNVAKLNYLEVPAMLKYKFGKKGTKRVFVNGGVYYGRLLSAETETSGSSTLYFDRDGKVPLLLPPNGTPLPPISFDATTDIKNDIRKNNFGLTGGGGLEIPHGKNYFVFDARISYGLVSIQKDTVRNGDSKTGGFVISVGYAFGLK